MTGKNEKKSLHKKFPVKLDDKTSESFFENKNFLQLTNDNGKQSIERTGEIKNRIIDYYVQLYFLS